MAEVPLEAKAREALEAYAARTAEPPSQARLDAVWRSAETPRRPKWIWLIVRVAAAAAVALFVLRPEPLPPEPAEQTVRLDRGGLAVRPRAGQVRTVVTPQATLVVQQAAAWIEVTREGTVLAVESGEVVWRTRTRSGTVTAGGRATLTDDALPEPPPVPRPTTGLTAEAALYESAMQAEGAEKVRLLREHRSRFPDGIFAPEVSIGLMLELRSADEARAFQTRFPSDPRAPSIRRWAAQLE